MITVPKLLLIVLLVAAVWVAFRWLNPPASSVPRRRPTASPRPAQTPVEDLTARRVGSRCERAHARFVRHQLSGPDPGFAALLGRAGLRAPADLRRRGRRRHLPP